MKAMKRLFIAAVVGCAVGTAGAADFPSKPVRLVVGYAPGGIVDVSARILADKLSARLGQPVLVENRPGADQVIALNAVTNADPDGHTLLYGASSMTLLPALSKAFTLDLTSDVTPITTVTQGVTVVAVSPKSPFKTMEELLAALKANPGKLNMASAGATNTMQGEVFKTATGTKFEVVRYTGAAPGFQAMVAGNVDFGFVAPGTWTKTGQARALITLSPTRSSLYPEIPALGESSLPELRELAKDPLFGPPWFGVMGPRKLPRNVVITLYAATRESAKDADQLKRLRAAGTDPVENPPSPEEFARMISNGVTKSLAAAKQAGIQPQ